MQCSNSLSVKIIKIIDVNIQVSFREPFRHDKQY